MSYELGDSLSSKPQFINLGPPIRGFSADSHNVSADPHFLISVGSRQIRAMYAKVGTMTPSRD